MSCSIASGFNFYIGQALAGLAISAIVLVGYLVIALYLGSRK